MRVEPFARRTLVRMTGLYVVATAAGCSFATENAAMDG